MNFASTGNGVLTVVKSSQIIQNWHQNSEIITRIIKKEHGNITWKD